MRHLTVLALLIPMGLAHAQAPAGERIAWERDLTGALAKAKETGRVLMICINARMVEGQTREEPAAKGLREVVYRDARVVAKSREFVCAMVTPESGEIAHGELRALGLEGKIVSPQHIFVNPAGDRILLRKEYWTHGKGAAAVEALLALMEKAQKLAAQASEAGEGEVEEAPAEGEARAKWIEEKLAQLRKSEADRRAALAALLKADKDGDCTNPLIAILGEEKKDRDLLWAIIRALGRDGLKSAAIPISKFLGHRDPPLRANAAVSLEYIGSREKKVVSALLKAAGREKDEAIANHIYRALGRCGAGDARVRALLLKKAAGGKSEFACYGPAIGLAYFEKDPKAARGVEKILAQIGVPGSRRGGGRNTVKRGVLSWTLAAIGDRKSATFVREELISKLENVKAFWVQGLVGFWNTVAMVCDGNEEELANVEAGVRIIVGFAKRFSMGRYGAETRSLMDDARNNREGANFKPKGDHLLEAG